MRTEHLQSLPDGLLVEDMFRGIWIIAVLDTLHVLQGRISATLAVGK